MDDEIEDDVLGEGEDLGEDENVDEEEDLDDDEYERNYLEILGKEDDLYYAESVGDLITGELKPDEAYKAPKILYHYTSLAALMSIVQSKCIWASSLLYLNDTKERNLTLDFMQRLLPGYLADHGQTGTAEEIHSYLTEHDRYGIVGFPFVASFSEEGDSILHWEMYCPRSAGISIGFRTSCIKASQVIKEPPENLWGGFRCVESSLFGPVKYVSSSSDEEMKQLIGKAEGIYQDFASSDERRHRETATFAWRREIMLKSIFYKLDCFQNEKEYRLAIPSLIEDDDLISFRAVNSTLIPYTRFTLKNRAYSPSRGGDPRYWVGINHVIVGPSPHMKLTQQAIKAFFASLGLNKVEVRLSNVPLRAF